MVSLTTTFTDGSQVEVGMFGYESVIGVSALMGAKQSLNPIRTQIAGLGIPARWRLRSGSSSWVACSRVLPCDMFKRCCCRQCSRPAATRSTKSISAWPAGCCSARTVSPHRDGCGRQSQAEGPDRIHTGHDTHSRPKAAGADRLRVLPRNQRLPRKLHGIR